MPTELWRPRWVAVVTLLRAVGHVLNKVDSECSIEARAVIEEAWEGLKGSKPEIFWQFIEEERNNVLKAYEFGPAIGVTVRPGTIFLNLSTGDTTSSPNGPTTFDAFMRSGSFEGQDPLTLCRCAIEFWRVHLDDIDRQVSLRMKQREPVDPADNLAE